MVLINKNKKLIPNLSNKSKYLIHYKNLQLHLSFGVKLTKVYKIWKFKQSDWLKKYIDFNTDKRKKMLLIVLKKTFLNWWIIVLLVKQYKI